jgi:Ankyrin repeats (3 copies)
MIPSMKRKRCLDSMLILPCSTTKKVAKICSSLPDRMIFLHGMETIHPEETLHRLMKDQDFEIRYQESLSLPDFFSLHTEEEMHYYDADVIEAIRQQNISKLREFHQNGRPLKCSNRFGESLLHMACRRGFYDVVLFLIHEAKVPVRIRDDYGRTVLHDAAWTCEPNFPLLQLILTECPDLLYMRDRRGDTPISYARKSHWSEWNQFLHQNVSLLIPTSQEKHI